MKKAIALLLVFTVVLCAAVFSACSGSDKDKDSKKEVDEKNLEFITVGDLKATGEAFGFIKNNRNLDDGLIVCRIKTGAEGDISVPAEYDGKEVVAVVSEEDSEDKIASLTLEDGVSFIEHCGASGTPITTLSLPGSLKGIYASFNGCDALKEVSFPASVKCIVSSFNQCGALEKAATNGYVHDIVDSFCSDENLASVELNGAIQKMENSFDDSGVNGIVFKDNVHSIDKSFNICPKLESVTLEQIAGDIMDSFCDNDSLTTLTYRQGGNMLIRAFNNNKLLENVDFGGGGGNISASFKDCPKFTLPETNEE